MVPGFQKIQNYENRIKNAKVRADLRFVTGGGVVLKFAPKNGVKISNRRFGIRVSKNRENLIFELGVVLGPIFAPESDASKKKMVARR